MQLTTEAPVRREGTLPAGRARHAPARDAIAVWALRLVLVGLPLALWVVNTATGRWSTAMFASPRILGDVLYRWVASGAVWPDVRQTLTAVVVGLVIGATAGALMALGLASSRLAWALLQPLIVMGNAVPRVVLAPILTLWLGFGISSKIALVALMVFFPNFFNVYKGLTSVETDLLRWARSLGANGRALTVHVYAPSTVVWMLASLRTSVGFAFLAAIVGEYVGATHGIGRRIALAGQTGAVEEIFAGIVLVMALVLPIDLALRRLDRRLERWRPAVRRTG